MAAETHRMVCRSPVFPKTPRFGLRAFPHRVQNYTQDGGERRRSPMSPTFRSVRGRITTSCLTLMCLTPQLMRRPDWNGSQFTSKICGQEMGRPCLVSLFHLCPEGQNATKPSHTLSECPVAVATTRPRLQSHTANVFLASRPTDTKRWGHRQRRCVGGAVQH